MVRLALLLAIALMGMPDAAFAEKILSTQKTINLELPPGIEEHYDTKPNPKKDTISLRKIGAQGIGGVYDQQLWIENAGLRSRSNIRKSDFELSEGDPAGAVEVLRKYYLEKHAGKRDAHDVERRMLDNNRVFHYFKATIVSEDPVYDGATLAYLGYIRSGKCLYKIEIYADNVLRWKDEETLELFFPVLGSIQPYLQKDYVKRMKKQEGRPLRKLPPKKKKVPKKPPPPPARKIDPSECGVRKPKGWSYCGDPKGFICLEDARGRMATFLKTNEQPTRTQIHTDVGGWEDGRPQSFKTRGGLKGSFLMSKRGKDYIFRGKFLSGGWAYEFDIETRKRVTFYKLLDSFTCR